MPTDMGAPPVFLVWSMIGWTARTTLLLVPPLRMRQLHSNAEIAVNAQQ